MPSRIFPGRTLTHAERAARWRAQHREKYNKYQRDYASSLREKIFNLYGQKCNCCDEDNRAFLSIDHVNNNGAAERRKFGHKQTMYIAILRKGYRPSEYQILCMNCNWAKMRLGICPHKVKNGEGIANDKT